MHIKTPPPTHAAALLGTALRLQATPLSSTVGGAVGSALLSAQSGNAGAGSAAAQATAHYQRVPLLPSGQFAGRDGRPAPGKYWNLTDAQGQALAAQLTARHTHSRFSFDYEHQSLKAATNGQPAPASGWAHKFEWTPGQGLFAVDTQWTDRALAMLSSQEYAYISPVLIYSEADDFRVTDVFNAALVHTPSLLQLSAVSAAALSALAATPLSALTPAPPTTGGLRRVNYPATTTTTTTNPPGKTVNLLAKLLARLGLPDTTSEDEAISAVEALKAKSTEAGNTMPAALAAQLGLTAGATLQAGQAAIAALAARPADAATQVIADLQRQVAALSANQTATQVDAVVQAALGAGKLLPVQQAWATQLGNSNLAALSAFVASAPVIAPNAAGSQGTAAALAADKNAQGLTAGQSAIAAQLGIAPADYAKTLAAA